MKNKYKVLLLTVCAVLLIASAAFGTIAYLTDTESVTNTFTVGNVDIKLDETDVTKDDGSRTEEGNQYHLLPGHTYKKDPTVTVLDDSEKTYVRMVVEVVNIDELKASMPVADFPTYYADTNTTYPGIFLLQNVVKNWDKDTWLFTSYEEKNNGNAYYEFRYNGVVDGGVDVDTDPEAVLPALFTDIVIPGEVNNAGIAHLANVQIVVEAHAIQADGFADAAAAWAAFTK